MSHPEKGKLDIMRRTMRNLEFVETHRDLKRGPYEVTQLVNSFLGALAHPWEDLKEELNELDLMEAEQRGWPIPQGEGPYEEEPKNLGDLLRLVRNAFARGNITYRGPKNGEIEIVEFWNNRFRMKEVTWRASLNVHDLRLFLNCFVALAGELHEEALT